MVNFFDRLKYVEVMHGIIIMLLVQDIYNTTVGNPIEKAEQVNSTPCYPIVIKFVFRLYCNIRTVHMEIGSLFGCTSY